MAFDRVLGQDHAARAFRGILNRGRLAHAYLFVGPAGVGKATFAREVAKAVLCRNPKPDACDACESCARFEAGNHGDYHYTAPPEGKRFVAIEDIRTLQSAISIKPVEGGYKTFVVDDAHRMTAQAANAFLKTLEEPPPKSLLILIAPTLEGLLDTIISRCQRMRFRPITPDVIARVLVEQHDVDAERAAALAQFAGGSIGRATALAQGEAHELRDWIFDMAGRLAPDNAHDFAGEVVGNTKQAGASLEETRGQLRVALGFLLLYYRDLLMLATQGAQDKVFNVDRIATLEPQAGRWPAQRFERAVDRVLEAMAQLDMNANVTLLMEGLLMDLAR